MHAAKRPLFLLAFLLLLVVGGSIPALAITPAQRINIPAAGIVVDDDDDTPEITDRVARVSFVEGTATVKRAESQDWEAITLNLPLVEGDEVSTGPGSRLELQFGKDQFVRVAPDSALQVVTLRDDGIALSLSSGTLVARLGSFDKGKAFFEIDAPKTTIAVERSGTFRVDAGRIADDDVRVAPSAGGEAHVYSETAGFLLKSGRSAHISIAGSNAGEWQTADAEAINDDFDAWSAARDSVASQRIKQAHYSSYYDDDMYGADDLDGYGDWVNTSSYGWVWRPYSSSVSMYADWSPYRYGNWRWMPPFGWIWVNDEPWGWATYHHGRWVYDSGRWVWAPYSYYRTSRSWWYPALVAINFIDINVTWYPISYHDRCRWDYWGHRGHGNGGHGGNGDHGGPGGHGPGPGTVAGKDTHPGRNGRPGGIRETPIGRVPRPAEQVPPGGVVGVAKSEFLAGVHGGRRLPPAIIRQALERTPDTGQLITLTEDAQGKVAQHLRANAPRREPLGRGTVIGAGVERQSGAALDESLQKSRVFGGRTPKPRQDDPSPNGGGGSGPRPTGVITRDDHRDHQGRYEPPTGVDDRRQQTEPSGRRPRPVQREPVGTPPPETTQGQPVVVSRPERQPRPMPRSDPPTQPRSEPRQEPRREPRQEQPRPEPRKQPQPKQEAPRSEPKRESAPPAKKDGGAREKPIDN